MEKTPIVSPREIPTVPLSVETVIAYKYLVCTGLEVFTIPPQLRRELEIFFGGMATDISVFIGDHPHALNVAAHCEGRNVILDRALLKCGPDVLRSTLAHEFAHVLQQRRSWGSPKEFVSVVEDQALEAEAQKASACFLCGEGLPPLTIIPQSAYNHNLIIQCQEFGTFDLETLQEDKEWKGPKEGGKNVNIKYNSAQCRNEIYALRLTAHARAKKLAGDFGIALRTYHFTGNTKYNEGVEIKGYFFAENDEDRRGRYYDFGNRQLIVEHTSDPAAIVTVGKVQKNTVPHFHISKYGESAYALAGNEEIKKKIIADGLKEKSHREWLFDGKNNMYMPYLQYLLSVASLPIRKYEVDERFVERNNDKNKESGHHIYYWDDNQA